MLLHSHLDFETTNPYVRGFIFSGLSDIAYEDDQVIRAERLSIFGLTETRWICAKVQFYLFADTECSVIEGEDLIIVAFRGSETDFAERQNLIDWLNNFEAVQTLFYGTRVHVGFAQAVNAAIQQIEDWIRPRRRGKKIWFTGHSLGGALALLAGYYFEKKRYSVGGIVNFGSPRVGGLIWLNSINRYNLNNKIDRWINMDDPVPRLPLPLQISIPGSHIWNHVGAGHYINWEKKIITLDQQSFLERVLPTFNLEDHKLLHYKWRIWELLSKEDKDQILNIASGHLNLSKVVTRMSKEGDFPRLVDYSFQRASKKFSALCKTCQIYSLRRMGIRHF